MALREAKRSPVQQVPPLLTGLEGDRGSAWTRILPSLFLFQHRFRTKRGAYDAPPERHGWQQHTPSAGSSLLHLILNKQSRDLDRNLASVERG